LPVGRSAGVSLIEAVRLRSAKRDIGLLLPCNVIVYADTQSKESVISVMDPVVAFELTGNTALESVAIEVRGRLERALDVLERSLVDR
jgi:uncharacterized protein (DUF302 family)